MRYAAISLFLLLRISCFAQTGLPLNAQNFAIYQTGTNSYTMRGNDIQALQHAVMDMSNNCLDGGYQTNNLFSSLVAWWPNIGNTLTSQSLNLINPAINSIAWTGSPTPNDGYMAFNGTTQYGNCGNSSIFGPPSQLTVSAWIKTTANSNGIYYVIAGIWNDVNQIGVRWQIYIVGNGTAGHLGGTDFGTFSNNNQFNTSTNVSDGNWHHVVKTGQSGTNGIVYYVDGIAVSTFTPTGTLYSLNGTQNNLYIGQQTSGHLYSGSIQDVMIFNTVLTATQITNLYNWTNNNLGYSNKH